VTGGLGNIGQFVIRELLLKGDQVRCLDIETPSNLKKARKWGKQIEFYWGNIWSRSLLSEAVSEVDAVIHLAFIIPPLSEKRIELSDMVNLEGTRCVIETIQKQQNPPILIFTSSISVYGRTQHISPPRTTLETLNPVENYAKQKVKLEQEIKEAAIPFVILRIGAAPPIQYDWVDPILFEIPLNDRMEYIAPEDAGLAIANSAHCREALGKILLIGGGATNQITMRKFLTLSLQAVGIRMLPCSAFGKTSYHCDWMDTSESQNLLQYQRHSFDDYMKAKKKKLALKRSLIGIVEPFVRTWLLKKSPYYQDRTMENCSEKIALITGASSGIGMEISKLLAKKGFRVILTARNKERLNQLAQEIIHDGGKAQTYPADLCVLEDRERLVQSTQADFGRIDLLINNAGFGWYGNAEKMPWDISKKMIQVNLESVVHLTSIVLPSMLEKMAGHIINIGSIAGDIPNQGIAMYGATKAFLSSYSNALFRELKGRNVKISIIKPGPVATNFFSSANRLTNACKVPAEKYSIEPIKVASAVWSLIKKPKKTAYIPGILSLTPSIEFFFGWIIDRLGPLLLKKNQI
jgi:short-subunit dehydrogenase